MMNYLFNRFQEKSTWTALGVILAGFGVKIRPDLWDSIMMTGALLASIGAGLPARVKAENVTPPNVPDNSSRDGG